MELDCRLGILESYFKQALAYQSSIERLAPEDSNEAKFRAELEDLYCTVKSKILTLTNGHRKSTSFHENMVLVNPVAPACNLPKLKLPHFSGKYSEFPNFFGTFSKLVDKNESLSVIEKFNHLLSCLSGAALLTVKAFEVTDNNYDKALGQLKARYDNKYLIFQEHIVDFFNLPKVHKGSASQLRYLVDSANAHLNALQSLGSHEEITHAFIIYLVNAKLDPDSQGKWEESLELSTLPTWTQCSDSLNKRCQFLEAKDSKSDSKSELASLSSKSHSFRRKEYKPNATSLTTSNAPCSFCKINGHHIYKCTKLLELPVLSRFEQVKRQALCINCLTKGHGVNRCPSSRRCRVCSMPHNTILHRYTETTMPRDNTSFNLNNRHKPTTEISTSASANHACSASSLLSKDKVSNHVFLAAAVVEVKDKSGQYQPARALLDSASQLNFITENLAQTLRLKRSQAKTNISGLRSVCSKVRWSTEAVVRSRLNGFSTDLSFHLLPHITGLQPDSRVAIDDWDIPENIQLADPQFFKPQRVDLLIGADTFFKLLCIGQIKLRDNLPTLQKTVFGWVVSGKYSNPSSLPSALSCNITCDREESGESHSEETSLNELVERFWKEDSIEELSTKLSAEHIQCEVIFQDTTRRLPDGKFMVKLPFKDSPIQQLTNSLETARRRFLYLEKKLAKDPELKAQYSQFLQDYVTAGHMERIYQKDVAQFHYFMPHRCVLRPESSTTKLRVVFDSSCRTASNKSLNDLLMVGPTIQDDLYSIISRFRCYKYALTADISAMFRQILVYPEDQNFQLILWRDNPKEEINIYRLKTVTYGTAPAPFLATRCLLDLAQAYATEFPKASRIVQKDFYMDDLLTGADTRGELEDIRRDVSNILASAQFQLRKWYSNHKILLSEIPESDREKTLRINDSDVVKTLGIIWDPEADEFRFQYKCPVSNSARVTKRSI